MVVKLQIKTLDTINLMCHQGQISSHCKPLLVHISFRWWTSFKSKLWTWSIRCVIRVRSLPIVNLYTVHISSRWWTSFKSKLWTRSIWCIIKGRSLPIVNLYLSHISSRWWTSFKSKLWTRSIWCVIKVRSLPIVNLYSTIFLSDGGQASNQNSGHDQFDASSRADFCRGRGSSRRRRAGLPRCRKRQATSPKTAGSRNAVGGAGKPYWAGELVLSEEGFLITTFHTTGQVCDEVIHC